MTAQENWAAQAVEVSVPASTANLGPGFDTIGLGLEIRDRVVARLGDEGLRIEVTGAGADEVPLDDGHLVHRSMIALWQRIGVQPPSGLNLLCDNVIPHSRGLGSSASAIVAGVAAALALVRGTVSDDDSLALISDVASDLEGHPDNASASVYGGATVSWRDTDRWRTARLTPHPAIAVTAFVPSARLSTDTARAVLPASLSLRDAATNSGRAALLAHALTNAPDLLLPATADLLHQEARRPAYPGTMDLVDRLRAGGHAAFVSGAGPSVLVLGPEGGIPDLDDPDWQVWRPAIATTGVRVESHTRWPSV
ncbi:homoserine kinase [Calidifontibacter sp. DB0510]|uniref:Homoserine kinase n=1 Tax=Metallococcus carri TaxID=1656884 RepID=A0A967EAY3_9MICO|nr:homoserine kinase [Metallococcus carri]NHN56389.1 homoserine kinase [Metallococcus carri]NOP36013.1 homoserine kinase [Calidifontibacter sp. DB2511S]